MASTTDVAGRAERAWRPARGGGAALVRLGCAGAATAVARRGWHRVLVASLDAAVEATRLIGSGYRFANVRRVCDGELLLAEAREQLGAVRGVLGDG